MTSPRQSRLEIELGGEKVDLMRLEATESLSQPFHFEVYLRVKDAPVKLLPHLGKPATISVHDGDTLLRYFHGIAVEGNFLSHTEEIGYQYRLTLRPQAFLHEHGRDFRVFEQRTTKEILDEVLTGCGIKFDLSKVTCGEQQHVYCVQYGESDFGFACRLMEEEGIYYYYKHDEDKHTLMLCDGPNAHSAGKATPMIYRPSVEGTPERGNDLYVTRWQEHVSTGAENAVFLKDYDFSLSRVEMKGEEQRKGDHDDDNVEVYEYPGRNYIENGESPNSGPGSNLLASKAKRILDSRRASREIFSGECVAMALACGTTFTFEDHGVDWYNTDYLVTQTRHTLATETYRTSMGFEGEDGVWFESVPAKTVWRAPITTRRPVVLGPETAVVLGESNTGSDDDKILCDKYGRVKVQFHWDRHGDRPMGKRCWVRVSQFGHLGTIVLPRVGQEVLVDFVNGDPDRPVITGRLFNDSHMPIYTLPDNQSRAVWRSKNLSPSKPNNDGKSSWALGGGNEITLEDKDNSQEVLIRAEKDMNTYIINNNKREVGKDETITIKGNQSIDITGDQTVKITGSQKIDVTGGIDVTCPAHITFKCGASEITLNPGDITIKTPQLKMEGSGTAELKGGLVTVQATGINTIKGSMVLIN